MGNMQWKYLSQRVRAAAVHFPSWIYIKILANCIADLCCNTGRHIGLLPTSSVIMEFAALKVMLIGKGAREHSLAWKLAQSPTVEHIYVVPGNAGTQKGLAKVSNMADINGKDYAGLVTVAKSLDIGLVVVGPDDAVVDGIEGHFRDSAWNHYTPLGNTIH